MMFDSGMFLPSFDTDYIWLKTPGLMLSIVRGTQTNTPLGRAMLRMSKFGVKWKMKVQFFKILLRISIFVSYQYLKSGLNINPT